MNAEPTAPRLPELLELVDHEDRAVGGNGETDADRSARRRNDSRVHADDFAVHIEQRTAGIPAIDGGVGLQEVVVGAGVDVAPGRGDDADAHAAAEAERVADRHHPVAHAHLAGIAERHGLERFLRLDLQECQVGLGVVPQDLGDFQARAVGEVDKDLVGALDDVVVGNHEPGRIDDEARAERTYLARQTVAALFVEEIVEELLEGRALGARPAGSAVGRCAVGRCFERLGRGNVDDGILETLGDVGHRIGAAGLAWRRGKAGEEQRERGCQHMGTPKPSLNQSAALKHVGKAPVSRSDRRPCDFA